MRRLILIAMLSLTTLSSYAAEKIKVACVGNSITFGAGMVNNAQNSYPAQLQALLGDEYEVRNFGVSATTILRDGVWPYMQTDKYRQSLEYNPDIVFLKMGTNAVANRNVKARANFAEDYRHIVDTYRNLPSKPRVILLTPVRSFYKPDHPDELIVKEIIPAICSTANERDLDIINLHNLFGDEWVDYLMPDRLHPSSIGAGMIAKKLYQYLTLEVSSEPSVVERFPLKPVGEFEFYGYKGYNYNNDGVQYRIVKPRQVAEGNPWIWRARFWGHEPQVDIEFLERGFHLLYCDVGDLFGSPEAVKRWDKFYKLAVEVGLNKKVVLEGMSRGGLIIYNWAVKNPDKVACIYADAPVMDLKSWPMNGAGTPQGQQIIDKMFKAYGFSDSLDLKKWQKNPIDHARKLAKAKIPMIHVVGDVDQGVPVAENTAVFEERLAKYGYKLYVIHKPNCGHHPHSLNNPEPIVSYILQSMGRQPNFCTHPTPGNEFRSGAGWSKGADWHKVAEDIELTLEGKRLKLLLLGNSIVQGFGGNRKLVVSKAGKEAMDSAIGAGGWEAAGISGDRTQHLLWRLQHGDYNRCKPEVVTLAIGINNLTAGDTPQQVAQGIVACAEEARRQMPEARIILFGLLPAGAQPDGDLRKACDAVHAILAKSRIEGVEYINPTPWFVESDGNLRKALYAGDNLHLSQEGYALWSEKIAELVKE